MGEQAVALGVAMSDVDNAKLQEAAIAMVTIGQAVQGVAKQIAIELAPFVTAIADQMLTWMKSGTRAGILHGEAIDWVTTAVGGVDVVAGPPNRLALHAVRLRRSDQLHPVGIDKAIQAFGWLYEKITGVKLEVTNMAKEMSRDFEASAMGANSRTA